MEKVDQFISWYAANQDTASLEDVRQKINDLPDQEKEVLKRLLTLMYGELTETKFPFE